MFITMSVMFSEQFYPHGMPLSINQVSVNCETVQEIFLRFVDNPNKDDESILVDYIKYFINAPLFRLPPEIKDQMNKSNSFDALFDLCLEWGIDPI